ncbi:MAG: class I SAM-dependent methyltransferase [Chloroflexota bacterium]|nr:class I SAM-dependent methyltransferase [Chloroflexota bacterium]
MAISALGPERVVGVDIDADRIMEARGRAGAASGVEFHESPSEALPFQDGEFDGVLLNEVLEHVSDEIRTLQEAYRVLRPGGCLVIMSPNRWFPFEGHGVQLGHRALLMPVPFVPYLPASISSWFMRARNYWPGELADMARAVGFTVQSSSSLFPTFEFYPCLPSAVVQLYRRLVPVLERAPLVRRFGVSTAILAYKPLSGGS